FFTTTPTSDIYTLSLHDALPIFLDVRNVGAKNVFKPADRFHAALFRLWQHGFEDVEITVVGRAEIFENGVPIIFRMHSRVIPARSEEHTSELQSRFDLVCRLLLE